MAAWFWLFSKGSTVTSGLFGNSGAKSASSTVSTNGQTNVPQGALPGTNAGAGTNVPLGGVGGSNTSGAGTIGSPFGTSSVSVQDATGIDNVPGVDWLGGSGVGGTSGSATSNFSPTGVNQLNGGSTGGQVTILGTGNNSPAVDSHYGALFAAVGIGTALCTAGLIGGVVVGGVSTAIDAGVTAGSVATGLPVNSVAANFLLTKGFGISNTIQGSDAFRDNFLNCITRTIGRAIVDQITASVVNWINGGFHGSPSFVQNYGQFFANVADQAAGTYIKGSALAFLCSPFQLQVKIAIAKSYANRNSGGQCTLTGVVKNITNFANGNFSQGGWGGLLQLTTMPTNNPFGAYAFAQIGLASAQNNALNNANKNITPGGFISYSQAYDCSQGPLQNGTPGQNGQLTNNSSLFLTPSQSAAQQCPSNCKCKVATPGSIIESNLIGTQNSTLNQLNLAKSFDEIISALITQLMTRTLQQGLSNLSGAGGYQANFLTPDQQAAQDQGNALLTQLQTQVTIAQQYGQVEQGSVSDIESVQGQLATLQTCYESKNDPADATTTATTIAALEAKVSLHNNNVTRANQGIAALQSLQTQTLNVTSTADVAAAQASYNTALASGVIITQNDITQAQQDRSALQSVLVALSTQAQTALAQCQAQQ